MKVYEIWSEGYRATGEEGSATFHGTMRGDSFHQACDRLAEHHSAFAKYYETDTMTYWGCQLFDNEKDARARYG